MFKKGDFVCIAAFAESDPDDWGRVLEVKGDEVYVYWGTTGASWWNCARLKEYDFGGSQ